MWIRKHCISLLLPLLSLALLQAAPPDLGRAITINVIDGQLEEILREVSRLGEIEFSYPSRRIDLDQRLTVQMEKASIAKILDRICEETGMSYRIVEEHVVLRPARKKELLLQEGPFHYTLSGYVRDRQTNEVLIGATVYVASLGKGTISNEFGYYAITLPQGRHTISFSYIGYQTHYFETELLSDRVLDLKMEEEPRLLKEVIVSIDDDQIDLKQIRTGNVNLEPRSVQRMPAFLGEQDVIKSLDALPGIQLQGDGSTLFFVRGGNKDQNLILIDDAPIYNPAHFLGIFSTFIPEAVKDIDIYKGDIPARYGGRLSSLIDVRTKDGDMNRFVVNGSAGLATAKLSFEGPLSRGRSSFFLSGRTSYIKWYLRQFNADIRRFYFNDFNGKASIRLGLRDRLHLSAYMGKDYFSAGSNSGNTSGISWGNLAGTIRWNHLFNDKLFVNTTLYSSRYDYHLLTNVDRGDSWNSSIGNLSLKSDFSWFADPGLKLRFGAQISRHHFNPGNFEYGEYTGPSNIPVVSSKNGRELTAYISNNHRILPGLSIRYGIRATNWQNLGEATEYRYNFRNEPTDTLVYGDGEVYHRYFNWEPRFGLTWMIARNSSIKASYTRTVQYMQLVTNSVSPFTTLEAWLPAGPNIAPQKADQFSFGYFKKIPALNLDLSLEGFYKKMYNQIDYRDHAYMLLNPHIEKELAFGQGTAYGFEILLKKYFGKLNGWIGYAWTRSWRQMEAINGGRRYPAAWDRPHDLSFYLSYNINDRWIISSNWLYMTGSAFSAPTAFYHYNGYTVPIYEEKNNDRLPAYHRLDLSTTIRLNRVPRRYSHQLAFSIYNLYSRKNPFAVNFNKTLNRNETPVVPEDLYVPATLVPSMIYMYQMVPAISYRFTFR